MKIVKTLIDRMVASTQLTALIFAALTMSVCSAMTVWTEMTPDHWLKALEICAWLFVAVVTKRAVDGVGKVISGKLNGGKNGQV